MQTQGKRKRNLATSNDVALHAKVSQATVSRVFNNSSKVRPETIQLVMNTARELGYMPNAIARSLSSQQTDMIAVVSVGFDNPFYQTLLIKISDMISSMGKKMIFIQLPFDQALEDILYQVMEYQVDGIVVFSAALSARLLNEFIRVQIPLVIFNKHFNSRNFFSVCSDNVDAGQLVADYLMECGYRSFGFLSGRQLSQTSDYRYDGYAGRLREYGFSNIQTAMGDYSYASGYHALLAMREAGALPDAMFCVNDLMALGAMDAARNKLGMHVPEDIAFVGFDNLEQGNWESYRLTSVQQPVDEMVSHTFNYLSNKISRRETSGGYVLLKCKLVVRESTCPYCHHP